MTEFERINMLKEKKGVPLGRFATNPITGEEVPIFAGNFFVASYGTGAVMAVPGHDQRDYDFPKKNTDLKSNLFYQGMRVEKELRRIQSSMD
ncbi:MAG: hypothetical protein Ct9H90mP14_4140 [Methanobacteriota archaeon]|nr:MAG: hypothetical protein Ct9H90mP14_4140 [Euryarchaeota archaeon]